MLYTQIQFKGLVLKNRLVMSPMCMYSAENGVATDFHKVHYGSRAQGGVGLIIVEATGVEPRGRITNKCLGLWNEQQSEALKEIVSFVHNNSDTKIGIQLAHAGRKGSTFNNIQTSIEEGWETIAPSPIAYKDGERIPKELSIYEINEIVESFVFSAQLAIKSGFDVLEIHAAHGYLVHQFLSPISNVRKDHYGGSFENRIRFLLQIIDGVNRVLPDNMPLFVRVSATDYAEEGWDLAETIELSKVLKQKNVDLIDVSSGGNYSGAKISLFDGYQVQFSEKIRKKAAISTGAVGLIKTSEQANVILKNQQSDLIFIGRELLRNPYLAITEALKDNEKCSIPHQYERGFK